MLGSGLRTFALALVAVSLVLPSALAEFGPESAEGYPINVNGDVVLPPVPPMVATQLDEDVARAYGLLDENGDPLNKAGPFTFYPYYPLLTLELQRLAQDHPDLVKLTSAGKSTLGLDLWLLEIADFARIESGEGIPLDEREVLYLDGGTHSNEYSGVYFVTELAQFLLDEYATNETAQWIVENRHTWILPMINPDGSNAFGRLNAKTVNINRNFPGTWGAVEENPVLNNPGPEPGSEIETQTVMNLMDAVQPDYVNSIHCCGNLWLHPYGAEHLDDPADMQMFTRICDEAFMEVREDCGEIWSTIYPASGTTADEGYERSGASSWTYEMSGRANIVGPWGEPTVMNDVRVQERESWGGVMHAFLNVEKYGARPQLVSLQGTGSELTAVVENLGYGNLTFGNLTIGGQKVALPFLGPNERATLTLSGEFAEGPLDAQFDWVKRQRHMTQGVLDLDLSLVAGADGVLVGTLANGESLAPLSDAGAGEGLKVPGPATVGVLAGLAAVALALRRRE